MLNKICKYDSSCHNVCNLISYRHLFFAFSLDQTVKNCLWRGFHPPLLIVLKKNGAIIIYAFSVRSEGSEGLERGRKSGCVYSRVSNGGPVLNNWPVGSISGQKNKRPNLLNDDPLDNFLSEQCWFLIWYSRVINANILCSPAWQCLVSRSRS